MNTGKSASPRTRHVSQNAGPRFSVIAHYRAIVFAATPQLLKDWEPLPRKARTLCRKTFLVVTCRIRSAQQKRFIQRKHFALAAYSLKLDLDCSTRTSAFRKNWPNSRCFLNGSSQRSDFNVSGAQVKPACTASWRALIEESRKRI